jgi:hypothetical protein
VTEPAGFRIVYENPRAPVAAPEPYEGYDVESAFYDHLPSGARATIAIDGYALELTGVKLVDLVRQSLPLAEKLSTLPADSSGELRQDIPDLPPDAKAYMLMFADFMFSFPYIVFARQGAVTRIYTRTASEEQPSRLVVLPERDRADPVVVPTQAVIDEIRSFLTRYLDDVVAAFPFIAADEKYRSYRERIAALSSTGAGDGR